jgi:hypothetical protein
VIGQTAKDSKSTKSSIAAASFSCLSHFSWFRPPAVHSLCRRTAGGSFKPGHPSSALHKSAINNQHSTFHSQLRVARPAPAPGALARFEESGVKIEPAWINGEYAWDIDRPSYYLASENFLVRRAPDEADGDDCYGCKSSTGAEMLASLGLPAQVP